MTLLLVFSVVVELGSFASALCAVAIFIWVSNSCGESCSKRVRVQSESAAGRSILGFIYLLIF